MLRRLLLFCLIGVGLVQAELMTVPWAAIDKDLKIWKPEKFDSEKKWPAVVFFHGTNGEPTIDLLHAYGGADDFVLVGMTYKEKGRFQYNEQSIANEMGLLNALKKLLVGSLSVDPERIYVGGFSKGGWYASLLLERDRSLAGGLILGGGVFEVAGQKAGGAFKNRTPIYIASGRYDGNYPQSLRALLHFRKMKAEVSLETWPGVGHEYPKEKPLGMIQWLKIQADGPDLEAEARDWLAGRRSEIEDIEDPVERWYASEDFLTRPFVLRFGSEDAKQVKLEIEALSADPAVATEQRLRGKLREILRSELKDRRVDTLQQAALGYSELAQKAKGTRVGDEAEKDANRTMSLLAHTKEVAPADREIRPATTPTPVSPSSPLGGRGGFPLMPGVKVKPAE